MRNSVTSKCLLKTFDRGVWFTLPQVIPTWRGQATKTCGRLPKSARGRWRAQAKDFLACKAMQDRLRVKLKSLATPKLCNANMALACDHALQGGVGASIKQFRCDTPPTPLPEGSERRLVATHRLPSEIQAASGDRPFRALKRRVSSGLSELELVASAEKKRFILHAHADQCSANWPHLLRQYRDWQILGWVWPDPAHRRFNNWKLVLRDCGARGADVEMRMSVAVGTGPWKGCGHFCKWSEAMEEYMTNCSWRTPCFSSYIRDLPSHLITASSRVAMASPGTWKRRSPTSRLRRCNVLRGSK